MVCRSFIDFAAGVQDSRQDSVCLSAVRELLQDLIADLGCLGFLFGAPVHLGEQNLEVRAIGVLLERRSEFGNRLRKEIAVCIHPGQRPAGEPDFMRLEPVPPADQSLEFLLDRRVGRVGFEGALHMPNGGVEVALVFAHDRHADVGDKVIRHGGEHALEDVR